MERQFTSGSRQAPDPFDQFLEEHHYYRKHTARDASCLFRVISEQMYDTQMHHLAIREKCVTYMRKHRKHFDYHIDRDFDEYLDDMSKPKTYGTLLELQAASYMFERNVFLFQPFDLGNYLSEYRSNFVEVFRIFYTPERHFDSVFTSDYIQEAAICQSLCYEILYKDLFKLPDVSFAVEQMLHGPTFENMDYRTENNEEGYPARIHLCDGRYFDLDMPHNTSCILENYKLCHFHNSNFPRYSDDLQRELRTANYEEYDRNSLIIQRTAESFLPNKYVSCVRQLLQEGITPFPYKVAKALDPNMYRNIEFDSWNEMRKEMKLQNWYNGDANFKVGAKCHVKLRKSEQDLYTCHIQEIGVDKGQCIVFIEQLGEKRLVPYENLTPLPPDQFKPWTVPYRLQRHMQKYSSVRYTRQYNYRFKFNLTTENNHHRDYTCGSAIDSESCSNTFNDDDPKKFARQHQNQHCTAAASYFKLKQYTHLEDFRTHVEYCTMPLTVSHSSREVEVSKTGSNQSRAVDSNENSRTPSRSSTSVGKHRSNMESVHNRRVSNNVEDHLAASQVFAVPQMDGYDVDPYNPNGAFYVPEIQGFYPMYPYAAAPGMPEDYYGYCTFDGVVPTGAALMPPVNNINGFYYLCNNTLAAPANYINSPNPYFLPAPPPQSANLAQPSAMTSSATNPHPSYCTQQTAFNGMANGGQSNQCLVLSSSVVDNTSSRFPTRSVPNTPTKTPLSGRINYDAKKSTKANGIDLPNDMATLRFFYNMGLDYYQKQKSKATEGETNTEEENLTNDMQNLKVDENGNNIPCINAAPIDNETNLASSQFNKNNNGSTNSLTGGSSKGNNQRRYSSRYFSGKDRQMSHRNNSNQNSQQQQFHQNHSQHNQRNNYYNNNVTAKHATSDYNSNNFKNTVTCNTQQQNNQQHHLQVTQHVNSQHLSHAPPPPEPNRQISPNCGFDNTATHANSVEAVNCHTPSNANNANFGMTYTNSSDQINDGGVNTGVGNNIQLAASIQSNTNGVYIPIPMAAGPPPPPPPYGIFAAHPTANGPPQTTSVGRPPSFVSGPPPQLITHCGFQTPTPGVDSVETICSSDMPINNNTLMAVPPSGMQIQCPSYAPPMPFYYSANGVNTLGGNTGSVNGGPLAPASANNVHLVGTFSHQITPSTPSNQTSFASPHAPMGTQGFYCLQPPPLLPPQQPVTPQLMQQPPTQMTINKTSVSNSLPQDNNGPRNDLVQQKTD